MNLFRLKRFYVNCHIAFVCFDFIFANLTPIFTKKKLTWQIYLKIKNCNLGSMRRKYPINKKVQGILSSLPGT